MKPPTQRFEYNEKFDTHMGYAGTTLSRITTIGASYQPDFNKIEVVLMGSTDGDGGLVMNLTPAGWDALINAVQQVYPIAAVLTADKIHTAATIIERMSGDYNVHSPDLTEWSAERLRYEAEKCYRTNELPV